jgi:hypothetical protein
MSNDDIAKLADLLINLIIDLSNDGTIGAARYEDEVKWLTTLTPNLRDTRERVAPTDPEAKSSPSNPPEEANIIPQGKRR